jgi:hypothetical protein
MNNTILLPECGRCRSIIKIKAHRLYIDIITGFIGDLIECKNNGLIPGEDRPCLIGPYCKECIDLLLNHMYKHRIKP